MCCYTFGVPRVGNHAFARLFNSVVPDAFNLVNGSDLVPQSAKFLLWQPCRWVLLVYCWCTAGVLLGALTSMLCLVSAESRRAPGE